MLKAAGFEVFMVHPLSIVFAGTRETFEKAFRTTLVTVERPVIKPLKGPDTATFIDDPATDWFGFISTENTPFRDLIEGIAIEVPRTVFAGSPMPLDVAYYHLTPPHDLARLLNAHWLHQFGITGRGVRVAMVDSGYYPHPYYIARGYNIKAAQLGPVEALIGPGLEAEYPGVSDPAADFSGALGGHGTGELANIVSVAPEAEVWPIKCLPNGASFSFGFQFAVQLAPDIITCSWGASHPFTFGKDSADVVLELYVSEAVANGITVVFSAGNQFQAGFPGQMPDVISVGGVYVDESGAMQVSDHASAFSSELYPGRHVPDVSGLCGLNSVGATYIMLPVQPGCTFDLGRSLRQDFPDQTSIGDGWACFSGTSAAAPQVAGVVALMKQVAPQLWPWEVKASLQASATPVVDGRSHPVADLDEAKLPVAYLNFGLSGWEGGAGAGLVNAAHAVYLAALHS